MGWKRQKVPVREMVVRLLVLDSSSAEKAKKMPELEMSKRKNDRDVKVW